MALFMLMWVRDHDGTLCSPKKTGADTEKNSSKKVETRYVGVDGGKQTSGVDTVSNASECEGIFDTKLVDKGTTKETKNCKCTVERGVLVIPANIR